MASIVKNEDFQQEVQDRFIRYARIATTSDSEKAAEKRPSTEGQWDLLNLLKEELIQLGIKDINLNEKGYLIARIPSNVDANVPSIGFMAHVDTSSDAPGQNVQPLVHENYDGGDIQLPAGICIEAKDNPDLQLYKGESVITSDGSTLLGADDKAGVAEIMTVVSFMQSHSEWKHGPVEIIFTPDEETGHGMDDFPLESLQSSFCYTVDAGAEGEMEYECYYAWKADIRFQGRVIHPGFARGKLVNALTMGAAFISMLPRNESPEATDGRFGNYWPHSFSGSLEQSRLQVFVRDFDRKGMERRLQALKSFAQAVEAAFPGGKVEITEEKQYLNMREGIEQEPRLMEYLEKALLKNAVQPLKHPIRGGTDGSRLTEMGIPAPNIFTGGHNFHSRGEWVALPAMDKACKVLLSLLEEWSENTPKKA